MGEARCKGDETAALEDESDCLRGGGGLDNPFGGRPSCEEPPSLLGESSTRLDPAAVRSAASFAFLCAAICAAIEKAAAPALDAHAGMSLAVDVTVLSDSHLRAKVKVNGKALPDRNVASSDAPLSARGIEMLANSIAAQLHTAG